MHGDPIYPIRHFDGRRASDPVYFLIKLGGYASADFRTGEGISTCQKGRKRFGNTNQRETEGIHFSFFYNDYIIRRKVCKFTGMYEYRKRAK